MKPKRYPYSGKRQKVSSPLFPARPILNEVPIVEEVKTFRESDWKFFIRDLVNEFVH